MRLVSPFLVLLLIAAPASATRMGGTFTVIDVAPDMAGLVSVGDVVTGQWDVEGRLFGPLACPACPPEVTSYSAGPGSVQMTVDVGPFQFADTAFVGPQLDVWNGLSIASPTLTGTFDAWSVIQAVYAGGWFPGSSGPALPVAPTNAAVVQLLLADSTASVNADGSIHVPTSAAPYDVLRLVLSEIDANGFLRTLFISEATVFAVPEPSAAVLLALVCALARRRSTRAAH